MSNQSAIFWFSGTGNSLYIAKRLSAQLDGLPLISMAGGSPPDGVFDGNAAKIGFVFPAYYNNLPRDVRSFIEKLDVKPDTYIFAVITMGGFGNGTLAALRKALATKGLKLYYGACIHMPANFVLMYNPANPDKSEKASDNADKRLRRIAADISERNRNKVSFKENLAFKFFTKLEQGLIVKKYPFTAENLYNSYINVDAAFSVSEKCTGCGLCEKLCPARNIKLENGKPKWQGNCEHCVSCISWCPVRTIEYESNTQARRRYRNLRIKANELTHS
jgi:ferredoxin/flavodoxin